MSGRWLKPLKKKYLVQKDSLLLCALYVALQPREHPQKLAAVCQYMAETWDRIMFTEKPAP
jgi:hypothetical protein